jgi:penicillin-binding protein-related factor A (putative recombinase)
MAGKGIVWERVCTNSRERLRQDGRLAWCRMHPPVLKIGAGRRDKAGSFLAVRTGKGPPDWVAVCNGISILGDDKDCKTKTGWQLGNVKKHQAKDFDTWEEQGGIACILLRMPDKSRWVLPWQNIKTLWAGGKTIKLEQLCDIGFLWEYTVDSEPNYDWLTPLLRWRYERRKQWRVYSPT